MNIFYLHEDPYQAAAQHCDKHVVKMILESAQMLCTAHRILDKDVIQDEVVYKIAHKNHPSTVWVRNSLSHYQWLYNLFTCLCDEYTFRYNKVHLTDTKLRDILKTPPINIIDRGFISPPQCMPDEYKNIITAVAYRDYYVGEKEHLLKYTIREEPSWLQDALYNKHLITHNLWQKDTQR